MERKKQIDIAACEAIEEYAEKNIKYLEKKVLPFDDQSYVQGFYDGFLKGAEWADANLVSPWISVHDKLPDNDDDIFVSCECDGKRCYTWMKGYLLLDGIMQNDNIYDYWMPVPAI